MSFRFSLGGLDCQCDTPDELRSVALNTPAKAPKARVKATKARKARVATLAIHQANGEGEKAKIPPDAELPLIEGALTWPKIRKAVKKVGLTEDQVDMRLFRSALKRRQDAA